MPITDYLLPAELDRLVRPSTAASLLGVTIKTIGQYTNRGDLPCLRTSANHRRFKLSDILKLRDEMVARGATHTKPA